jgi:hypothetical protein
MVVHLAPIMLNDLDLVSTVELVSTSLEEASIFISFNSNPDFPSLFPHQELGMGHSAEDADNDGSKISVRGARGGLSSM